MGNNGHSISNIIIYPNPNSGSFKVSGLNNGAKVYVINQLGAIIKEEIASSYQIDINLEEYPRGVYFIRTSNKPEFLQKVIVD